MFFFLVIPENQLIAQRKSDIGIYSGISSYMGDINPSRPFYRPALGIGAIYRYNLSDRLSFRGQAIYHSLSGSDLDFINSFQQNRGAEFAASFVDLAVNFEFNWWPYKTAFRKTKYSPYVLAGLGYGLQVSSVPGSRSHLTIPFGFGVKANLGKRLSGGLEWMGHKAFSDMVDGLTNTGSDRVFSVVGNNDWYMFTGVFITYKIFEYRDDCPTYDQMTGKTKRH
ncbi:MAG: DUF6089 family protein [Bacteroidota bacterium]